MSGRNNVTALQLTFKCLAAIGLAIYLSGVFVYHLYTQRPDPQNNESDEQA